MRGCRSAWAVVGLVVGVMLGGCAPTYAPPVRSPHYGAPGRLSEGDVEVAGGAAGFFSPTAGGGWLGYGVRDWISVEAGADGSELGWGMGYAGVRLTHAPRRDAKFHAAFDFETALGAGAGGSRCGNKNKDEEASSCDGNGTPDGRSWRERGAGGAVVGGGAGYHLGPAAGFVRGRLQLTGATNVPATLWSSVHAGLQFRIARTVDLFSSFGHSGYYNQIDHLHGWTLDFGLAIRIPTCPPRRCTRTWHDRPPPR
jgi:hypothetical protein